MDRLHLTDDLLTGVETIDEQHQQLFDIANDLIEATARGEGEGVLRETFERLRDYATYHFRAEQDYMEEIGYLGRDAHATEHALLAMQVKALWGRLEDGENVTPAAVAEFLSDWITDHIKKSDGRIGEFVRAFPPGS